MRVANPANLVSVREASKRTGIPARTLYHWIASGRLDSCVVADRICIDPADLSPMAVAK